MVANRPSSATARRAAPPTWPGLRRHGAFQPFGGAFGIAVATAVLAAQGQLATPAGFTAGIAAGGCSPPRSSRW